MEEDAQDEAVEDEKSEWDENNVRMQLEREAEQQRKTDWQQLIREIADTTSTASELSSSPQSSITNPWGSESENEAEEEVVDPQKVKHSWVLVPRDTPGPETRDTTARSCHEQGQERPRGEDHTNRW